MLDEILMQQLLSSSMDKTVRLWDIETQSCLKMFAHNDYVTCIHFNPVDDDHFISGSLDGKVRIWNISDRKVMDWTDLHEMVTATCHSPDGEGALIGSHKGSCRLYSTSECKLEQKDSFELEPKKKSPAKKVTGFQEIYVRPELGTLSQYCESSVNLHFLRALICILRKPDVNLHILASNCLKPEGKE
nr:uncharacterized WD repeat-containing protein C18H10.05-like [Solanum lycopersicum]